MTSRWHSCALAVIVPESILRRMWNRARRSFGAANGGFCDARSASTMLLWSHPLTTPIARPVGVLSVHWSSPRPGFASIGRFSWVGGRASREAQLWRALEELAGADWPGLCDCGAKPARPSHAA